MSDAGTPDRRSRLSPGTGGQAEGIAVVPVPGASAVMAALSVAGLPTDRFTFRGFLPAKAGARRRALAALAPLEETQVFFEAPHRIVAMLEDAVAAFGSAREAYLGRELTKRFESHYRGSLGELRAAAMEESLPARGNVVVLAGASEAMPRRRRYRKSRCCACFWRSHRPGLLGGCRSAGRAQKASLSASPAAGRGATRLEFFSWAPTSSAEEPARQSLASAGGKSGLHRTGAR